MKNQGSKNAARLLKSRLWLVFLALLLCGGQAFSLPQPAGSPPFPHSEPIERGLEELYNLDFSSAFRTFRTLIKEHPEDPAGYCGQALAYWWQIEMRLGEFSKEEERSFLKATGEAIHFAQEAARKDPHDARALLCLGGNYGVRGRWEASQRQWILALRDGRRGRRSLSRALALDPRLEDGYMGVGLFDYYTATLPGVVQALSFLGRGDKEKGLSELKRVADRGVFGRTAAQLLLIGIDMGPGKKPQEALKIARELRARYPESPFMHLVELMTLFETRRGPEMEVEAQKFVDKIRSGAPHYAPGDLTKGYYMLGAAACLQGKWQEAIKFFTQAVENARPTDPFLTGSLLYRGQAYDALGARPLAVADYRRALKGPKLWDYKMYVERYLHKPYAATVLTPPDQTDSESKL